MLRDIRDAVWNIVRSRTFLLSTIFCICFLGLLARVFYLQIIQGSYYAESTVLRTKKEVTLASTRGNIFDRNGEILAYSELAYEVTIEDNGSYPNTKTKNGKLNQTIYDLIQLIEKNGDSIISDFPIILENGKYKYTKEGTALLRFKADVYGYISTSELEIEEELATAEEMMEYLCGDKKYQIKESYTEKEIEAYDLHVTGYTQEEQLEILTIRYAISLNGYMRYVATTVANDISEETLAAIIENQNELQGVGVKESTKRTYNDSVYFSNIIGYIGKASEEELEKFKAEDDSYVLNDVVGKTGIESYMELELQGEKGYEFVYVDSVGRVVEVAESTAPVSGNDVYLTIDKDLQIATYQILEQKLAGILVDKIKNIKTFEVGSNASSIEIPIYDVYFALINNNIIDVTEFDDDDATELEQSVYQRFLSKKEGTIEQLLAELTSDKPKAYENLSKEMKNHMSYIVATVLRGNQQVLMDSKVDTSDPMYQAWTVDEVISLKEYLEYAIAKNWIDVTKISTENEYLDSDEIYQAILDHIKKYLEADEGFEKRLYEYILLSGSVKGSEICRLLYEQGALEEDLEMMAQLETGRVTAYSFLTNKISTLEITPAQLALEPCSGAIVIVDVNTGDTLACVAYPTVDNNKLTNTIDGSYWNSLTEDLSAPFLDRATQQGLAPGSIFKPITAIAAMEEGAIGADETVLTKGEFTEVTPSPRCWIYKQYGETHGNETIATAIRDSCNYFFYEMGYRLSGGRSGNFQNETGLAVLEKYASMFGLSEVSGLELSEREPHISDETPITSAIGQGSNSFTVSQLAKYMTTIANEGTCYNLTLLDKLESADGNVIEDYHASVYNQVEIAQSSWDAVKEGLVLVAEKTSSLNQLGIATAGKTGTAEQSSNHPPHALFAGFAPVENPEIAVVTRIPNGYTSAYTTEVAADVFKYYYGLEDTEEILTGTASSGTGQTIITD